MALVESKNPVAVIVCGPSGVGKTTIGSMLAKALNVPFVEGDDFHSEANVSKMRSGTPLTDEDRAPWLARLRREVVDGYVDQRRSSVVLACSALKKEYRRVLQGGGVGGGGDGGAVGGVFFVLLFGDADLISRRLSARSGHFMPPTLLASQLATLEPLDEAHESGMTVDLSLPSEVIVKLVVQRLTSASCL